MQASAVRGLVQQGNSMEGGGEKGMAQKEQESVRCSESTQEPTVSPGTLVGFLGMRAITRWPARPQHTGMLASLLVSSACHARSVLCWRSFRGRSKQANQDARVVLACRWEKARNSRGEEVTRPVVRLEVEGRPVFITRISPEFKSTSVLVRPRPGWRVLKDYLSGMEDVRQGQQRKQR